MANSIGGAVQTLCSDHAPDPRDFGLFAADATGTACFVPRAPWLTWHEGRSPATVRRDELTAIEGFDHARELVRAIEAAVGERAA
ncbi:MAG TPA: hypothetical protein VN325_04450 [Steroidobacteraceae bacterium]|nr:hypothetical protein [Steroidobacteraceae bacterium]